MTASHEKKPLAEAASLDLLFVGGNEERIKPERNLFNVFKKDSIPEPATDFEKKENKSNIVFLSPDILEPYPNHIFGMYSDEKLRELAESIAENGIHEPLIIRQHEGKYQILAGHNRTAAAKLASLVEVPCIIEECDEDKAALIVVDTNLNQRENLLPSERAKAYKIQMDCFNKRGKNVENSGRFSDNNKDNQEHSLLGNKTTIYRFIRLTYLIDELLQAVDDGKLAIFAGEELSYIDHGEQGCIYQYFFSNKQGILDIKAAKLLRERASKVKLTFDEIERLFQKERKLSSPKNYSIPSKRIQQYIPLGTSKKDAEATIIKALKYYTDNYKEEEL